MAKKNILVPYRKRNMLQMIDKMDSMSVLQLDRFNKMFYRNGLKVWQLIVFQRLGVKI